jgi:hypothetical protein
MMRWTYLRVSEIGMRSIQSIGSTFGLRGSPYCSIHSFARRGPAF